MNGGEEEGVKGQSVCDHGGQEPGFADSKRHGVVFRLNPGCGEEEAPRPEVSSGWELFLDRDASSPSYRDSPSSQATRLGTF